jgi:putative acetyltransferase
MAMETVQIRPEAATDAAAIDEAAIAAFLDAPHAAHTEQFIVRALRQAGALRVSLVAELDGTVVGHVAASPVQLSNGAGGWFGLGPHSVRHDLQGRRHGVT